MKCTNCNKEYKVGDRYCEHCGKKIKKESKIMNYLKQHSKAIIISIIIIILAIMAVIGLNYLRSPEYKANQYFKAVINKDTKTILEIIDKDETTLYNASLLEEKTEDLTNAYNITLVRQTVNDNQALLTYQYELNNQKYLANVLLYKDNDSIISSWKVESGKIVKNVTITLPKDSIITIDDMSIDEYKSDESDDENDVYVIDYMVKGDYDIVITLPNEIVIEDTISVSDNKSYRVHDVELTDALDKKITSDVKDIINKIYQGVINNTSKEEISDSSTIQKLYQDINYNYKKSNIKLNQIDYTDVEVISSSYDNAGKLVVTLQTEYNYNITYTTNDTETSYDGTNRGYVTVVYNQDQLESINNIDNQFVIRK